MLSLGYAGSDFKNYKGFDWNKLEECTRKILDLARRLKMWVILGSTHKLTGNNKPHNSLYIINEKGKIVDRYDKRFCAGNKALNKGDLKHYSSGDHFCVFKIKGIICGTLICHDYRYPELYREYKKKGVQIMFHSYHAGGASPKQFKEMQKAIGKFAKISGGSTFSRDHNACYNEILCCK